MRPTAISEFRKARTNTYQIGGGVIYDVDSRPPGDGRHRLDQVTFTERQVNIDYAFDQLAAARRHLRHR